MCRFIFREYFVHQHVKNSYLAVEIVQTIYTRYCGTFFINSLHSNVNYRYIIRKTSQSSNAEIYFQVMWVSYNNHIFL